MGSIPARAARQIPATEPLSFEAAAANMIGSWGLPTSLDLKPKPALKSNILRVGVLGYGYWGPNVVRNFHGQDQSRVTMVCDTRPEAWRRLLRHIRGSRLPPM